MSSLEHFSLSSFVLFVALVAASIAVIRVSDWYSRIWGLQKEMSIRKLEALFALPDPRRGHASRMRG
jgi:uncharacterized protein involved in outer membrane biogenesis